MGQATASATIVGTVTDSTGAVVGANVTATNKATGASRTTIASNSGDFRFDQVAPGAYTVKDHQEWLCNLRADLRGIGRANRHGGYLP